MDDDEMVAKRSQSGEIVWVKRHNNAAINNLEIWIEVFGIYSACLLHNHIPITPIDSDALDTAKFLVQGFREGFRVPYKGEQESFKCQNLPLANQNLSALWEIILKELQQGTIKGSFSSEPIPRT